mgnify:CR=1 FL=1
MFTAKVRSTLRLSCASLLMNIVFMLYRYERVKSRHLYIILIDESSERCRLRLELIKLLSSFVAGICQVEDVTVALRVEHDGVLVGLCHDGHQFLDDLLLLLLGIFVLLLEVEMIARQLTTEHEERSVEVGLFEHGMAGQQECHPHQDDYR